MRNAMVAGLLVTALSVAVPLAAQAAPAKPTPDWTGIWTREGSLNFDPNIPGRESDKPPYNPEYTKRFESILAAEAKGQAINDRSANCEPPGIVRMMNMVYPMEILQTPGQVTLIAEWMGQIRRIFTDGRPHPADPDPTYNGHSIGRWEGDKLIVDTVAIIGGGIINDHGAPLGDKIHVTEKYWAEDPDTLKLEITVESPDALLRPITATKTFKRRKDIQIMEYACQQNNRNPVGPDGVTGVILK